MAPKLILSICFMITFMFLCSSETITDIDYWCGQMPHPKTCYHFVASKLDDPTKMLSKGEFLNMTIAATLDEAIFVRKKTKRIEDMTPQGLEKAIWDSCVEDCDEAIVRFNETLLDTPGEPIDRARNYDGAVIFISMCEDAFDMRNITSIFPLVIADLHPLMANGLHVFKM